jgi:ParB/RepB/Spo0J family partition protein
MAKAENIRKLIDAKKRREAAEAPGEAGPDAAHAELVVYVRSNAGTKASDLMRIYRVSRNRAIAAVEEAARPAPEEAAMAAAAAALDAPTPLFDANDLPDVLPGQTAVPGSGVDDVPPVLPDEVEQELAAAAEDFLAGMSEPVADAVSPALAQAKENAEALVDVAREAARGSPVQCEEHDGRHPFNPAECVGAVIDGLNLTDEDRRFAIVEDEDGAPLPEQHVPRLISLDLIDEHPANPRLLYPRLAELSADIAENGLRDPIKVRPVGGRFEVFSGHRRLRAMRSLGWTETLAMVEPLDDLAAYERVVVENEHREDLTAIEEGIAFQGLLARGQTVEQIAHLVGKSVAHVYARMKLTALGEGGRAAMAAGWLTPETALLVARIPTEGLQCAALKEIGPNDANDAMSYREAQALIQAEFMLVLTKAPFDRKDAALTAAGACSECPKRSGALPAEIRTDVKGADVCLDRDCYRAKTDATWALRKAAAAEEKIETIDATTADQQHLVYTGDRLAEHNGICTLDSTCHEDLEYREWSKVLPKKAIPKPDVLIQSPLTGAAIPGWKRETLLAAAIGAGAVKAHAPAGPKGGTLQEKEAADRKKIKERRRLGGAAIERVLAMDIRHESAEWPVSIWRALALQALEHQWAVPMAKRLGFESAAEMEAKIAAKGSIAECQSVVLHAMLQKTLEVSCQPYGGLDEKPFRAMLADIDVDLKAVAASLVDADEKPATPARSTAPAPAPARAPKATLARKVAAAKKASKK